MSSNIHTNKGSVVIRPLVTTDATRYRNLRLEALQRNPTAFGSSYEERRLRLPSEWVRDLMSNENEIVFAAEHKKTLVGMAGIRRRAGFKTQHAASIWGVYVRPTWRGREIAQGLLGACLDWAREKQVDNVKLAVVTSNIPAVKVYESLGFQRYGTEPRVIFYEGAYYDEYLMAYHLESK